MVIAHAATASRQHFQPRIIKNMGLEIPPCNPKLWKNNENASKVDPRRVPKSTLKSIKTDIWASVCLLGAPLDPRITKMVSQVPKKEPQGLQNNNSK